MADGGELPAAEKAAPLEAPAELEGLQGPGIGSGVGYSAELAWAICARVAAGESLRRICEGPGMPHRTTVRLWANRRPEFAQALAAAQRTWRLARRRRDREAEVARRARPKAPRGGRDSAYTSEVGEEVCWRLAHGESLIGIARDPGMPCVGAVYRWLHRHDEFREMYEEARRQQADYLFDEAREVALEATARTVAADRLRFDVTRWQTSRLAARKYAERVVFLHEKHELENAPKPELKIKIVRFERSPDGTKVLAIPPRNEQEEKNWEEAYGERYSGPR